MNVNSSSKEPPPEKPHFLPSNFPKCSSFLFLAILLTPLILLQLQSLSTTTLPFSLSPCTPLSSHLLPNHTISMLRQSITFLPLKDLRLSHRPMDANTWFMSSLPDSPYADGDPAHIRFPSAASDNRCLCLSAADPYDGARNSYALAFREALPENSTLLPGLTFVADTFYDYDNLWHGLSAILPFARWHAANRCAAPGRWVMFHWGEARKGMRKEMKEEVYDMMRCRARTYCNLTWEEERDGAVHRRGSAEIRITLLFRVGSRSFKNETVVAGVFERECRKVEGCRARLARPNNLTFCDQVKLMSETDILVSPHGAQMTNMIFMDKNSIVMEFFPKGWLELAGAGQYVFQWLADWAGMRHRGQWRDSGGESCPFADDKDRCFTFYKDGSIGHDEAFFSRWAAEVLQEARKQKLHEASQRNSSQLPAQHACTSCG